MGATSGAHTAVGVVMTSPSSRTRDHRPAGFASAGIGMAAEAAVAAPVSRVGLSGEDGQQAPALQPGLRADSDLPGRSITSLVEGAARGVAGWPSVVRIDHS
jgi:hypothetical protein